MAGQQIDLAQIFQQVTSALQQNESAINKTNSQNPHGTHMVDTFNTITQALQEKQGAHPADQLAYAAKVLKQSTTSGSGQTIANGLQQAAQQFTGKNINIESMLPLIQMLLGGGKATVSGGSSDLLSSLLGGQAGGAGGALGGILGGQSGQGINLESLLTAGAGLLSGAQGGSGGNLLSNLVGSLVGGSQMADSGQHTQSGQIVAGSILSSLSKLLGQ
jgi:hypothetical protein